MEFRNRFETIITTTTTHYSTYLIIGLFRVELSFFDRVDRGARVTHVTMPTARYLTTRKILKKLLRIEIENCHIIMTMGMYRIEPPWISI
jgi:hypothetical protein